MFKNEKDFEQALINTLLEKGWDDNVIKNPTPKDLLDNWAKILFDNNRSVDRLGDYPLTDGEMQQILEQINFLRTPVKLNGFINGKTISIRRDNPNDKSHFGKEISLKIYDRQEIAAGQSRYQIVQQPQFPTKTDLYHDRRGDLMLLINGMPVMHIELKRGGIDISQAHRQIEKYYNEGVFTGIYSLVQIFVAMTPDETLYFANPGDSKRFNSDYYFHWADFNNEPVNHWKDIASQLLSIPMAHTLIGFYTIADDTDGMLKVMRSYQYYAANRISSKVMRIRWKEHNQYGGYIWHTTGSGKTLTSFKSAQLIANSKDADKVVFLVDRIELATQSLQQYRNFSEDTDDVQATENTNVLITKLKSSGVNNTLIVTSIQKMSRIKEEGIINVKDIELINKKRIVFIVDEAHRSTFGEMLSVIKATFFNAIFFGFTGTPIHDENKKKLSTTADIFGDELHRYSIADGIRDKNVLGFDRYHVSTFKDKDLREAVALSEAKAKNLSEVFASPEKTQIYNDFMQKRDMAGKFDKYGKKIKGIEDYIKTVQYETKEHKNKVFQDIIEDWPRLSHDGKFHAIFATSSIKEAIEYYRLFKERSPKIKTACLFDQSDQNNEESIYKIEGLVEMLEDYNDQYDQNFTMATYYLYKKDVALRLSHKTPYVAIENTLDKTIDILIVVNQMLTGYDSKWINTLYLDKILQFEGIVQAFSRTNRLFGPDKPFGIIKYYRKPYTMDKNITEAFKLYSGDKELGIFVNKLEQNLNKMNLIYLEIFDVFNSAGISNFEKLPEDIESKKKFASKFKELNLYLEAAKIQGFVWDKQIYKFKNGKSVVKIEISQTTYLILVLRYKELFDRVDPTNPQIPYEIEGYLTEIHTGAIDNEYMNSRFTKYLKELQNKGATKELIEKALNELHKTFATLTQEEQKYANVFLHDIQSGDVLVDVNKTFKDYIFEYQLKAKNDKIHRFAAAYGIDELMFREFLINVVNTRTINEYGRFDNLKKHINYEVAQEFLFTKEGIEMPLFRIEIIVSNEIQKFVREDGFEV